MSRKLAWSAKNNVRSFDEGWGLFDCDSGVVRILKLDDPNAGRPDECKCNARKDANACAPCRKLGFKLTPKERLRDDDEALDFVMHQAAHGSRFHRLAIKLAAGIK